MDKSSSLAKISAKSGFNLFWGVAISSIISSLGIIIIARLLSPEDYGIYSIALIAPTLIQIFRDLGIDQSTIRYTAKYEEENQRIMIQPIWTLLPTEEEPKTPKNIIANFVIPPHECIDIQSTHISNISNVEIELTLRLDNKIKEIAIDV